MVSEGFRAVRRGRIAPKLAPGHQLVTVSVLYYLPDHPSLLNEFLWQTMDISPRYPRITAFLDYWRREIEATIKEVVICGSERFSERRVARVDRLFRLH